MLFRCEKGIYQKGHTHYTQQLIARKTEYPLTTIQDVCRKLIDTRTTKKKNRKF